MPNQDATPIDGEGSEEPTSVEAICIVLADDHAVVRSGLRMLLDNESDFEVVAEAANIDDACRYVRGHQPQSAGARSQHARRLNP
jgi:hypothetical protein